jgi:four helix bundle protein
MDSYVHFIYDSTAHFPREESYNVTSQLKRGSLSVVLNYIEGFARKRDKVHINFLEISYGSLKESMYLLEFSFKRGYLKEEVYIKAKIMGDEIGAMLWSTLNGLKNAS